MSEEIDRLGVLVNEFDYPFHPHTGFIRTYKKVCGSHLQCHAKWLKDKVAQALQQYCMLRTRVMQSFPLPPESVVDVNHLNDMVSKPANIEFRGGGGGGGGGETWNSTLGPVFAIIIKAAVSQVVPSSRSPSHLSLPLSFFLLFLLVDVTAFLYY